MTNEELKKRIAQIIADYFCPQGNEHKKLWGDDRLCYSKMNFAECEWVTECTDALIAAGIGDVKEAEHRAQVAERALRIVAKEIPCDEWCPFSQKCNVELNGENGYQCCFDEYLRQAEKELAEERKDD